MSRRLFAALALCSVLRAAPALGDTPSGKPTSPTLCEQETTALGRSACALGLALAEHAQGALVIAAAAPSDANGTPPARITQKLAELVAARLDALDLLAVPFGERAAELGLAAAGLRYDGEPPTLEALAAALERDLERGATSLGPHLDDVVLVAGDREHDVVEGELQTH